MTDTVSFVLQTAAAVYTRITTMKINREEISSLALRINLLIGCLSSNNTDHQAQNNHQHQAVLNQINGTLSKANMLVMDMERQNQLQKFFWSIDWASGINAISADITNYVQILGVASDGMQLHYLQDIQKVLAERRRREDDVSGQIRLLRQAVLEVQKMKHDRRKSTVSLGKLHKTLMEGSGIEATPKVVENPILDNEKPVVIEETPAQAAPEESMIGEVGDLSELSEEVLELLNRPKYKSMLLDKKFLSFTESMDSPSGAFGIVHRGTYLGQPVVVKMLLTSKPSLRSIKEILDEAAIMKRYSFDFFATVYGICVVDGAPAIVMKRMDTDLFDYLHKGINQSVIQSPIWKIETALAVTKAVEALHALAILHRDLKSPNILVSGRMAKPLCISDFGMARLRREIASMQRRSQIELGKHETVGSYPWMAPEIMEAGKYTSKADIYSLGVILWEIWTGQEPWADAVSVKAIERAVIDRRLLPMKGIPPRIEVLLRRMFAYQPKERPSAREVTQELLGFSDENGLGIQGPDDTLPAMHGYNSAHIHSEGSSSSSSSMDHLRASNMSPLPTSRPPTISETSPTAVNYVNVHSHSTPDGQTSTSMLTTKKNQEKAKRLYMTSKILIGVASFFGLASIIAWTDYDEGGDSSTAAPVSLGCLCLILALVAVPLAFWAGKIFLNGQMRIHGGGPCVAGWMIAGWTLYAIMAINGLSTVGVGAAGGDVNIVWVVFTVLIMLIGWGLMATFAELGRRKAEQDALNQRRHTIDETVNASECANDTFTNRGIPMPATATTVSSNTYSNRTSVGTFQSSVSAGANTHPYAASTSSAMHSVYTSPQTYVTDGALEA